MGANFSGLSFVKQECRASLADDFAEVMEFMEIEGQSESPPNIAFELASVGDWWLSRTRGQGAFRLGGYKPGHHFGDRIILALTMCGHCRSTGDFNYLQPPGYITLCQSGPLEPVLTNGDFGFIVASIPRAHLEAVAGDSVPYDRTITALSGSGAVVAAAFTAFVEEAIRGNQTAQLVAMAQDFTQLALGALARDFQPVGSGGLSMRDARREKVLNYMKLHLGQRPKLTPAMVAKECGLSVRQLHRDFAAHNESFLVALMHLRLNAAASRLAAGDDGALNEIAYDCGFESPTHFARAFKAAYGASPSVFRKKQLNAATAN